MIVKSRVQIMRTQHTGPWDEKGLIDCHQSPKATPDPQSYFAVAKAQLQLATASFRDI